MRRPRFHLDHRFVRRRLPDYLDGDLEPVRRRRVERHLAECEHCMRVRHALAGIISGLRGLGLRASPRRNVAQGAIDRLRAEETAHLEAGSGSAKRASGESPGTLPGSKDESPSEGGQTA